MGGGGNKAVRGIEAGGEIWRGTEGAVTGSYVDGSTQWIEERSEGSIICCVFSPGCILKRFDRPWIRLITRDVIMPR